MYLDFGLRTDDLTVLLLAMVGVVSACVQVYSIGYLEKRVASYTALVTLFTAAMVTVVVSDSLFLLLIGWEVMGACSYLLIGHYWERRDARAGAMKAFLMTRLADVGFLFGIFVLGIAGGTFKISDLRADEIRPGRADGRDTAAPGRRDRQVGPGARCKPGFPTRCRARARSAR